MQNARRRSGKINTEERTTAVINIFPTAVYTDDVGLAFLPSNQTDLTIVNANREAGRVVFDGNYTNNFLVVIK